MCGVFPCIEVRKACRLFGYLFLSTNVERGVHLERTVYT